MAQKATHDGGADDDQLPDEVTRRRLDSALARSLVMPSKAAQKAKESGVKHLGKKARKLAPDSGK
jgi:hypothetical protein